MSQKPESSVVRPAAKAGSWYKDDPIELSSDFDNWISNSKKSLINNVNVKAIISPHAGYTYSGPDHIGSTYDIRCLLSSANYWETPFGNIKINNKIINQLYNNNKNIYNIMSLKTDIKEHSIELCIPYLTYIYKKYGKNKLNNLSIIPIIVGHLNNKLQLEYAKSLHKYFDNNNTLFIISSDFCHWGKHYDYMPLPPKNNIEIWKFISSMDHIGMSLIESFDLNGFRKYLKDTQNTICGSNPILLLLNVILLSKYNKLLKMKFIHYSQSNKVKTKKDFSVSYASGILYLQNKE